MSFFCQQKFTNFPNLSVSTTAATTTSVSPPVRSTSVTPPQTPPAASLSIPPVLVIVLGVVLLLLLVPLLILIQQNRVMRRALSKRRHRMTTDAVYEEIQHRHNHFTQRVLLNLLLQTTEFLTENHRAADCHEEVFIYLKVLVQGCVCLFLEGSEEWVHGVSSLKNC
ncbi:hypothetical protein QQF64_035234 [Cirrhinus molitorella]|uniref:Uncharacterized protein n=1 Tax=Cirrhinus molitorella TaxID=172907 RepID=A0ABR3NFK3_9TELE